MKVTMKLLSKSLLLLMFISASGFYAKADNFDELLILFVDEEYEKCLKKCEKFMDKKRTRREPLPYLYAAMSYYEMSKRTKYQDEYPKAFKEAMKYAGKFVRKDDEKKYRDEHEWFIPELTKVAHESALNYYLDGKASKAATLYRRILKIDEDNLAAHIMKYVSYMKDDKRSKAYRVEREIVEMKEQFDPDKFKSKDLFYIEKAFKEYEAVVEEMYNPPRNYEEIKGILSSVLEVQESEER